MYFSNALWDGRNYQIGIGYGMILLSKGSEKGLKIKSRQKKIVQENVALATKENTTRRERT